MRRRGGRILVHVEVKYIKYIDVYGMGLFLALHLSFLLEPSL